MGDEFDNGGAGMQLILAVFGESPRSRRARENIGRALNERGIDPRTIKTVDMMTEPERAADLRTVAAPQLVVGDIHSDRSMCGDLSDRERLDRWLDEVLDPGDEDPVVAR